MIVLRGLAGGLGFILLATIVWAALQTGSLQDFLYEGEALLEQPWGLVTLVDLYVGFALIAIIMVLSERSVIAGLLWALPVFALGNVWTAVWLALRLPRLADRLSRPDWPTS